MGPEGTYIFKALQTLSKTAPGKLSKGSLTHHLTQSLVNIKLVRRGS